MLDAWSVADSLTTLLQPELGDVDVRSNRVAILGAHSEVTIVELCAGDVLVVVHHGYLLILESHVPTWRDALRVARDAIRTATQTTFVAAVNAHSTITDGTHIVRLVDDWKWEIVSASDGAVLATVTYDAQNDTRTYARALRDACRAHGVRVASHDWRAA